MNRSQRSQEFNLQIISMESDEYDYSRQAFHYMQPLSMEFKLFSSQRLSSIDTPFPNDSGDQHPYFYQASNSFHPPILQKTKPKQKSTLVLPQNEWDTKLPPKEKKIFKKDQWTKNMLVFFKNPHMKYMEDYIERHPECAKVIQDKTVKRIFYENRKHITMHDYECLYRIPELNICWNTMLIHHKYLFHHLMVGKANLTQKIAYRTKIGCFEKAFRLGKFEYIN